MTTIRVVLDDRRHTFITEPAVEGMLCDDCPQPHPATTEIVDDPSGDSWGSLLRPAPGRGAGGVREAALVEASPRPDGDARGSARSSTTGAVAAADWSLREGDWCELGAAFGAHYLEAISVT